MRKRCGIIFLCSILCFVITPGLACPSQLTFRVANYNVQNLFDLETHGTEYPEFVPNSCSGWNREMFELKCRRLSRVIADIRADIVALEEVESSKALLQLVMELKKRGCDYPFSVMSDTAGQSVGCALLSKYPVSFKKDLEVNHGHIRSILKTGINVHGRSLIVYVNHWTSKKWPESHRIKSANVLRQDIQTLPRGTDYLVIGDFNSEYDEFRSIVNEPELNDSQGFTGINHVLRTVSVGRLVDKMILKRHENQDLLYNLWLELPLSQRWSYIYKSKVSSLDSLMVPASLYDGRCVEYMENTFKRFTSGYVFSGKTINRWQTGRQGGGKHLGIGYSDHLPIYADFIVHK